MPGTVFFDDYMFPTSLAGMQSAGMILESAANAASSANPKNNAIDDSALANARSNAMAAVLTWIGEGDYTYDALDEAVIVVADIDGDFELTEDEEEHYSAIWNQIPDAFLSLGAELSDVRELVNGPGVDADKAAARVGKMVYEAMENEEADDDSLIMGFAYGEDAILESSSYDSALHAILEATYKRKKVVRDGQVQIVQKRVSGKTRLSAAQKAGLRKARRKANTASAKLARRKSMKIREARGM